MENLSQEKRKRMIAFLKKIKEEHKDDDETLIALDEIENELNSKKYGLVWEKHEEKVDRMMQDNIPVFTEVKEREIKATYENSYNFLLEGDNLHSLKLLEKTHAGKIDVIYIDPPYNTRNKDFIYDDTFVDKNDGYAHSKWLSFMSERLEIAKRVLSDEGVIFISINRYEHAQLKILCDTIFGEENLLGIITWESTTQPINAGIAKFQIQQKCEFIYIYAKNKSKKNNFKLKETLTKNSYPHKGKYGKCRFEIIEKSDSGQYKRDSMKFRILGHYPREGKRWQIGVETARKLEAEGKLEIVNGIVKKAIYPEDETEKVTLQPFWSHLDSKLVGTAQKGKDELNFVMSKSVGFDTVKPTDLIINLLSHFENNITILDFFAGSGTTAHAVLELNKEDGGNRKFILCTNNENNICEEITYERIKRVIYGYSYVEKKKNVEKTVNVEGIPANLKYFKTDFIPKDADDVSEELLAHIKEMVELENGINIDNKHYLIILTDEQADELAKNWSNYEDVKAIYVSRNVLFTSEQNTLFRNTEIHTIPDYYFEYELKELGESW